MPVFHIRQGKRAGETVTLNASRIIIGCSSDCQLVLIDDSIDPAHASLEERGEYWILQDLGAPGGTWLNDVEIDKPSRIFNGDVIKIGSVRLEIQEIDLETAPLADVFSDPEFPPQQSAARSPRQQASLLILGAAAALLVLLLVALLLLNQRNPFLATNDPPLLRILNSEQQLTVRPGEPVRFITEASDPQDLAWVEFWVNDILQEISSPKQENVVSMQTFHQWSSTMPGDYILRVIAYDRAGQASQPVRIHVTVREP